MSRFSGVSRVALLACAGLGLAACAVPEPLSDLSTALARHRQELPAELAARALTVDDAVRLAVTHNLDLRVKAMETELAAGKAQLARYAMLPQASLSGAATVRSRVKETTSKDTGTGVTSDDWSTSEDRASTTADLSLSWNMVDLGLAVLRSGEEDDRAIIAGEKRRRALHVLVQDVRIAYWRAVVNETAERRYRALENRLQDSVDKARAAEVAQVGDPKQLLNHQRAIIDNLRQIAEMQRQTATSRAELAGLMGLTSSAGFRLVELEEEDGGLTVREPGSDMDALVAEALAGRPELRVDESQFRIDVDEVRAEMLKTVPGIGPFLGGHFDSSSFVRNSMWADAGLKVAWSLSDLISAPRRIGNAKATAEITRARRMATAMAVMTQVHVADSLYRHAYREFRLTEQMAEVDGRLRKLSGDARKTGSGSEIEEMKAQAASTLSSLRRLLIYSDLEGARAKRDSALGRNPLQEPPSVAKAPEPKINVPAPAPVEMAKAPEPAPVEMVKPPEPKPPEPAVVVEMPPPPEPVATVVEMPAPAPPAPPPMALIPQAALEPPPMPEPAIIQPPPVPAAPRQLVYLASYRDEARAAQVWADLRQRNPALSGEPMMKPVELGSRGRFVRLFATAADAAEATRICAQLAPAAPDCGAKGRE
ncbi:TolC family protein [Magnetospirillum sp. UT-4]|uniref:TolC family protein n=1 Tax=Magnetospirillum sp. UT-4 TaxID=2681467 RepID=UPI00137EFA08|nr:TolC family protein [Magnetospirillum sp. UT-4]CAA7611614.1 conserved exported hypothetical protein [Magnetospirillum sp. UT-4]